MTSFNLSYDEADGKIRIKLLNNGKQVFKTIPFSNEALNKLSILQILQDHPHIIDLLNFTITQTKIKMSFPFISETLLDRVQKSERGLPLHLVHSIFTQIISGLSYIHSHNLVHQDLKLENILIDENDHIYIIDFGFSRSYKPGAHSYMHNSGSLHYAAPEIWMLKKCEGPEVDMWSLGVCFFLMLTSYFPFGGKTPNEVWLSIRKGLEWIPKYVRNNLALCVLLRSLLCFSTDLRITLTEAINNPWVQKSAHSS